MRRATLVSVLVLSAAVMALAYGIRSKVTSSVVDPGRQQPREPLQTSSMEAELTTSTAVAPMRSFANDQTSAPTDAGPALKLADEETVRKDLRDQVTREVRQTYSLLLEHLGLTSEKKDALVSWLIDDQIARTWTLSSRGGESLYSRGKELNERERSNRIAAIIGHPKLRQFLALERNLPAYAEVQKIESLLQLNGVPVSDRQREELLKILVTAKDQFPETPGSDAKPRSIEALEQTITKLNEHERHVLELAPSVLSSKQVRYLFDQYEYRSENRISALEMQKKRRAEHPDENLPFFYPTF